MLAYAYGVTPEMDVNLTLPGTLLCFLFATVMCGKVDTGTRRYLLGSSSESARPHSQSEKSGNSSNSSKSDIPSTQSDSSRTSNQSQESTEISPFYTPGPVILVVVTPSFEPAQMSIALNRECGACHPEFFNLFTFKAKQNAVVERIQNRSMPSANPGFKDSIDGQFTLKTLICDWKAESKELGFICP